MFTPSQPFTEGRLDNSPESLPGRGRDPIAIGLEGGYYRFCYLCKKIIITHDTYSSFCNFTC
jgi:hypothetical protein